jgi:alcohol dehydrogenase, propanol-preferring
MEKEIKSVANITSADVLDFLQIDAGIPLQPEIQTYDFTDANKAIRDLNSGIIKGAKVLMVK